MPNVELVPGSVLYHKTEKENFTGFRSEQGNVVYFATRPSAIRDYNAHLLEFDVMEDLGKPTEYGSNSGWGMTKSPDGTGYWISMPASMAEEYLSPRD